MAVPDASVDPFKLSLANLGDAMAHGAQVLLQTGVTGFRIDEGRIAQTHLLDRKTGEEILVTAAQVVNAAGAWAGDVAALAGQTVHLLYSKGSLLITDVRITDRVINRLRQSSDADILVPGGTVSILGTTSIRIQDLREIRPTIEEIDYIIDTAAGMIPQLQKQRYIRAYAGVRPAGGHRGYGPGRPIGDPGICLDRSRTKRAGKPDIHDWREIDHLPRHGGKNS